MKIKHSIGETPSPLSSLTGKNMGENYYILVHLQHRPKKKLTR